MKKIVDDIKGSRWKFFVYEKNLVYNNGHGGICVLYKDVADDFDISLDSLGHMHIVAVTLRGDIVYMKYDFTSWTSYTVMESRSGDSKTHHIRLFSISGRMNLWYVYEHHGKNLLVHQVFDGPDAIGRANVIDALCDKKIFTVCCDNDLNTHILYVDEDEFCRYKVYLWSKKEYEERQVDFDNIRSIYAVSDEKSTVHVAYTERRQEYNVVSYTRLGSPVSRTVGFGVGIRCEPCIIVSQNTVIIQFCDDLEGAQCKSTDGGLSFSPSQPIDNIGNCRESYGSYRFRKNGLCIGVNHVLLQGDSKIVGETQILNLFSHDEKIYPTEIESYYADSCGGMSVSVDFVRRLNNVEEKLNQLIEMLDKQSDNECVNNLETNNY